MSTAAWFSKLRFAVSAALALLAGTLLAPTPAQASCGDYIMHGSHGQGLATTPGDATSPAGNDSAPMHSPCSGPSCSNKPIPFTPPPSTGPVEEERWAFPLVSLQLAENDGLLILSLATSLRAIHFPTAIYHPPR
jgi:hypothetical protein